MSAIEHCRSAALGGHVERCVECGHSRIAYNSCRNRHCPKCQGAAAKDWLAAREADLLPVGYFHLVFTLPAEISPIAYQNKAVVYRSATRPRARRFGARPALRRSSEPGHRSPGPALVRSARGETDPCPARRRSPAYIQDSHRGADRVSRSIAPRSPMPLLALSALRARARAASYQGALSVTVAVSRPVRRRRDREGRPAAREAIGSAPLARRSRRGD